LSDSGLLVGVDACILIEAVRLEHSSPNHPSVLLMALARLRTFDLWLAEQVKEEAHRALSTSSQSVTLENLLRSCVIVSCPRPSRESVDAEGPGLLVALRHYNDVPIAVALKLATVRPNVFVSSNGQHWRPSLKPLLGGVIIMTPRRFLMWLARGYPTSDLLSACP
jgi:hypothetical protein